MAKPKKRSRLILTLLALGLLTGALGAAFWPRPMAVDMGIVAVAPLIVTIDEEGRTRVAEAYVVSTPVAGRLQRVEVTPGTPVVRGVTVVAHMLPTNPAALDVRTREQARPAVTAAEAALRVARADMNAALANFEFAQTELGRTRQLHERDIASDAALERSQQSARIAQANVDTAEAAIGVREAEVANARSQLIGFEDQGLVGAVGTQSDDIPLYAPADGRILRIMQQSETTLPAGAPIMEIGDVAGDLELVVELISTDAVQVAAGDRVIVEDWGGEADLAGVVQRVDPFGVTKFSALGVEEQRVTAVVALTSPAEARGALGHGFRVEARVVIWEDDAALTVPASALFRDGTGWAVFAVVDGAARLTGLEIGRSDGVATQVLGGLQAGAKVILYPSAAVTEGLAVIARALD
jgi:HlyD family secretion protein